MKQNFSLAQFSVKTEYFVEFQFTNSTMNNSKMIKFPQIYNYVCYKMHPNFRN